jgi:dihydroorotate dehydrogenase (fumarate)
MMNLSTTYMGLPLKNPIIIGSSGLTKSPENLLEYERLGAAAVVMKSLFEEQIMFDTNKLLNHQHLDNSYPEALDYITEFTQENSVGEYMKLIRKAKATVKIPVFGSINCVSSDEWVKAARDIEKAGADGLELNIYIMPGVLEIDGAEREKMYFDIIENVRSHVKIPIALKVGYHFTSLVQTLRKFSWTGIRALVLFNRFYTPDINLKTMRLQVSHLYSSPAEQVIPLRWIAMLADKVTCDISASTGLHDADAVIKQLLVGAKTAQICSALFLHGPERIAEILEGITHWMEQQGYDSIDDFRGKFSVKNTENPVFYHRAQYMKHLSGTE